MEDLVTDHESSSDRALPRAVSDLARRLGADLQCARSTISIVQTGRMKLSLEAKSWVSFSANQTIAMRACAFDWRARIGSFGLVSVRDALQSEHGKLSVKALGIIPVQRAKPSAALTRSELMRYLAELAWAPDAILLNTALRWREINHDTLSVSAGVGASTVEVFFNLDSEGRISGGFSPDRPRSLSEPHLPTRWPWRYSDYRKHAGRWIPFAGEVAWDIAGKEIVYWQGHLKDWHV